MEEKEITALAREYAEWVTKDYGKDNAYIPGETATASIFLRWLSTRYCLVRKNNIIEEYEEAKILCGNLDPCGKNYAWNECKMRLLESLFPETAKEVEDAR